MHFGVRLVPLVLNLEVFYGFDQYEKLDVLAAQKREDFEELNSIPGGDVVLKTREEISRNTQCSHSMNTSLLILPCLHALMLTGETLKFC